MAAAQIEQKPTRRALIHIFHQIIECGIDADFQPFPDPIYHFRNHLPRRKEEEYQRQEREKNEELCYSHVYLIARSGGSGNSELL